MFDGVPLLNTSGIGRWASQHFKSLICDLGFDKIDMAPLRAVSVNSRMVLQSATNGVPLVLRRIKEAMFINEHDKIRILRDMFESSSGSYAGHTQMIRMIADASLLCLTADHSMRCANM